MNRRRFIEKAGAGSIAVAGLTTLAESMAAPAYPANVASSIFDVTDFGAVGDGRRNDYPAFQRALDAMAALSKGSDRDALTNVVRVTDPRGAILFIPFGTYRLSQTLHITRQMIIEGVNGAGYYAGSRLIFDQGVTGIVIHNLKDSPPERDTRPLPNARGRADWTVIRDLEVVVQTNTSYINKAFCPARPAGFSSDEVYEFDPISNVSGHGIVLYARARIENCLISDFRFDGIHIETDDFNKNANNWEIQNCRIQNCGRHGLYVGGANANAGRAIGVDCSSNCRWGIFERSFLGNTYIGCHVAENGDGDHGGAYKAAIPSTGRNVFLGCYSEDGQRPSELSFPTLVLGGTHGAGFSTRSDVSVIDHNGITGDGLVVRSPISHAVREIATTGFFPTGQVHNVNPFDSVVLADASNGPMLLFLPSVSTNTGKQYTVKKIDPSSNRVELRPFTSDADATIDNSMVQLLQQFSTVSVVSDGKDWKIVGRFCHEPCLQPTSCPTGVLCW